MLFVPSVPEMYPEPTVTTVHVAGLTEGLCGAARPTHFDGVTTVVAKLFSIVGPSTAYFGRKDFQQLAVVRRMAADLDLPVEVVGCPLVREPDGVAMSSRNAYLSADERRRATGIFTSLRAAAAAVEAGERDPGARPRRRRSRSGAPRPRARVRRGPAGVRPGAAHQRRRRGRRRGGGTVGKARLIDNVTMQIAGAEVATDLGVIPIAEQESTS